MSAMTEVSAVSMFLADFFLPPPIAASRSSQRASIDSATMVLSTVFGRLGDWLEPSARNSNLLPVKANGLVRLRSPLSFGSPGRTGVPRCISSRAALAAAVPPAIASKTPSSSEPRKMEMMAGGASLAPSRWSWPAPAIDARSSFWCLLTAWMTAVAKNRNCRFSLGLSPGSSRFAPESVPIDQLLCLPEPLTPANGFSWRRHTRS